jgi:hypothetical protein
VSRARTADFETYAFDGLLRLTGGPAYLSNGNPLGKLGMQIAFILPMSMLLLVPVTEFRLNLFYPALLILLGAHYLPFTFSYGMRMFVLLCAMLVSGGVVIALYFPGTFSLGGWVDGLTLFPFAWIGRAVVRAEARGTT